MDPRKQQIATFHTHLGALEFYETLCERGDKTARMAPVPRKLSVSCGTGVYFSLRYESSLANTDLAAVYRDCGDDQYQLVYSAE